MSSPRTIRLSFLRFSDGLRTQLEDKADALDEANRDLGKDRSSMKKEKKKKRKREILSKNGSRGAAFWTVVRDS